MLLSRMCNSRRPGRMLLRRMRGTGRFRLALGRAGRLRTGSTSAPGFGGPRCRGERRVAVVAARRELRITGGRRDVPRLHFGRRDVFLILGRALRSGRLGFQSVCATHIADIRAVTDHQRLFVDVRDMNRPEIVGRPVIGEVIAVPAPAVIAAAAVAIAVVDAAVEADLRPPITGIECVAAVDPAPIGRRPQHADDRRLYPGARHPVVARVGIGPIPWGPKITDLRHWRLNIDRQSRWRDLDRDPDCRLCPRRSWHRQDQGARQHRCGKQKALESHGLGDCHHNPRWDGKILEPHPSTSPVLRLLSGTGIIASRPQDGSGLDWLRGSDPIKTPTRPNMGIGTLFQ